MNCGVAVVPRRKVSSSTIFPILNQSDALSFCSLRLAIASLVCIHSLTTNLLCCIIYCFCHIVAMFLDRFVVYQSLERSYMVMICDLVGVANCKYRECRHFGIRGDATYPNPRIFCRNDRDVFFSCDSGISSQR